MTAETGSLEFLDRESAEFAAHAAERCVPGHKAPSNEMGHRGMTLFALHEVPGLVGSGEGTDPCTLVCCYKYLAALA